MASGSVNTISLQHFPALCHLGVVGNLGDSQLLELFLAGDPQKAQASFSALIDRHGPMVLRVCRQILGNPDDAQDAFQATFLVLVRQAGSVRKRDSVACWLYGIAQRVARRARVDAARRRAHERRSAAMAMPAQSEHSDRTGVLDRAARRAWPAAREVPGIGRPLLPGRPEHRGGRPAAGLSPGHHPVAAIPGSGAIAKKR